MHSINNAFKTKSCAQIDLLHHLILRVIKCTKSVQASDTHKKIIFWFAISLHMVCISVYSTFIIAACSHL